MPSQLFQINSKDYVAVSNQRGGRSSLIVEENQEPFAQLERRQGSALIEDLDRDTILIKPLTKGLGYRYWGTRKDDPNTVRGFWDSSVDTRFDSGVYAARTATTATNLSNAEVIRASVESRVDGTLKLWSFWDRQQSTSLRGVIGGSFNGSSWNNDAVVVYNSSAAETVCLDAIATAGAIVVLLWSSNDHLVYRSTDGTSYAASSTPITANRLDTLSAANADNNAGKLVEIGGELVAVIVDMVSDTITFFSSTNAGDTWSDETLEIPGAAVLGVATYPGIDDADKLYVLTERGLFEIDTAPSTWTSVLVYPNSQVGDLVFSSRVAVWDGFLWFAPSVGNDEGAIIVRMDSSAGIRDFKSGMGLDVNDGIPSTYLGAPRWLKPAGKFLYMSVGGHSASRNAKVLCRNGVREIEDGWHFMYSNGSANQEIEWLEHSSLGGTEAERLHFSIRTASSTVTTHYIGNPNANPSSEITFIFDDGGSVTLPRLNAGHPTNTKNWIQFRIAARDLDSNTSGDYIVLDYGVDTAAPTTNIGNFLSGTPVLNIGSKAGVEGYEIELNVEFQRDAGSTADTVAMASLQIQYSVNVPILKRYQITVGAKESALHGQRNTPALVIANLQTLEALGTQATFSWGNLATKTSPKYVKVVGARYLEGRIGTDGKSQRGEYIDLILEEKA